MGSEMCIRDRLSNSQSDAFVNFIRDRWVPNEEAKWETVEKVAKWMRENDTEFDPQKLATLNAFYSRRLNEVGLDFPAS